MYRVTIKSTNAVIHKDAGGDCYNYDDIQRKLEKFSTTFEIETISIEEDIVSNFTSEQISSYQIVDKSLSKDNGEEKIVASTDDPERGIKKVVWTFYFLAILVIIFIGFLNIIKSEPSIYSLIAITFSITMIIGLYGYIYNEKIFKRQTWVVVSWLIAVSLFLQLIGLFMFFSVDIVVGFIVNLIQAPMYYAIFKYSSNDNEIWGETINTLHTDVYDLLMSKGLLKKSIVVDEMTSNVTMTLSGDTILVNIEKDLNGNIKKINSVFANVRAAEKYIEKHTNIKFADFLA